MAVKAKPVGKSEPQIRDYWRNYRRTALSITVVMQIIVTLIIGMSMMVGGLAPDSMAFWVTLPATLVATTFLNYLIVDFLLAPLRDIAMAITSAANQKPTHPLANPNIRRYASNGFKPMLQFIYDRAAAKDTVEAAAPASDDSKRLLAALNETAAGLVIMDAEGAVQFANRAAPVATASDGSQKLDLLFADDAEFTNWLAECRKSAVHAQKIWSRVPNKIVGDDNRRIFNITANYEKGSTAEVVLVAYDATAAYQPEDDELDFISFAAHELRGPITVIRGYLDVLDMELSDQIQPDQKELFKRLIVSANRLSGYINNILNTSKYDRRHLRVHLSEESLAGVYDTIRDDMELRAQSQRRLLSVNIPSSLPTVAVDRSSISEVISNLIDNALKYSNDGGAVTVTADVDGNFVKVSIADNGIGMPANVVGNLFHKFYRSHRSREAVAGTGIGLYICKGIVESHGGKISVTSTENVGSTFSFTVPIYASVAEKLQANDHTNAGLISSSDGWIKNHAKYTG